jgi:hypothetical protein
VGTEEERREAFRATRDDLRRRIDALMEALRRPQARMSDHALLETGAKILSDAMKPYGFKFGGVREETTGTRKYAVGEFRRKDRAIELQVRSGVLVATYHAGERKLLHPKYLERVGAAGEMRFPGLSKDPLNAFRRLRTDIVRFAGPFLKGKALPEFDRPTRPIRKAT